MENAGLDVSLCLEKVIKAQLHEGIDVLDGQLKDLVKEGIIDPVKVTRSALQNAASVAEMILTTHALITDAPEKTAPTPTGGMPGGMGEY